MIKRLCTYCKEDKSLEDFSRQKTNPSKFYAWCEPCRGKNRPVREKRYDLRSEYAEMRAKAASLRKFDDDTAAILHRRHVSDKVPIKTLAAEYGASPTTIQKTIRRAQHA